MSSVIEKVVTVGGRNYTLAFSFATMMKIDRELDGRGYMQRLQKGEITYDMLGTGWWAGLFHNHRLTIEQAIDLLGQKVAEANSVNEGLEEVSMLVNGAIAEYHGVDVPQPPVEESEAGDDAAENPSPNRAARRKAKAKDST